MGFPGDSRAHRVGHTQGQGSSLEKIEDQQWDLLLSKNLMLTFLQYLNARRVSAVSPDCEIKMHTSSLKEQRFLNLENPFPKAFKQF